MNKKKTAIFLLAAGIFVALFIIVPRKIIIKNIACRSQFTYCGGSIDEGLNRIAGNNYTETKKKIKEFLNTQGMVQEYRILYKPLNSVVVNIILRKGVSALKVDADYYIIDKNGYVILKTGKTDLKYFNIKDVKYNIGDKIDSRLLFFSNLIMGIDKMFRIKRAYVNEGGYLEVESVNAPLVIFPKEGDRNVLLGSLRLIINQLNKDAQNLRMGEDVNSMTLDLRYKNPVIRK